MENPSIEWLPEKSGERNLYSAFSKDSVLKMLQLPKDPPRRDFNFKPLLIKDIIDNQNT